MREDGLSRGRVERLVHDLACPLTVIRGACFELERRENDPSRLRRLRVIDGEVERIAAGLAELSRWRRPRREALAVADLVRGVVERMSPVARRTGRVVAADAGECGLVLGDRARIERALDNLVMNGLRYCRDRVEVASAPSRSPDRVAITVADDGPGVARAERHAVFRAGHRGRAARGPGRGLGLAIAREVAAEHGGRLWIADGGRGARFVMELPLSSPRPAAAGAS